MPSSTSISLMAVQSELRPLYRRRRPQYCPCQRPCEPASCQRQVLGERPNLNCLLSEEKLLCARITVLECPLQVDVLEYYDVFAHSARAQFMLPAVLRVRMYIQRDHHGRIALSRRNIMLRDGLACQ